MRVEEVVPSHDSVRLPREVLMRHAAPVKRVLVPMGGRAVGDASGRHYDPEAIGLPIARPLLTIGRIRVTARGVQVVERHLARFGPDGPNAHMIGRLWDIVNKQRGPELVDLNFYAHELREFVRYRKLGHATGSGGEEHYQMWNNLHTATLEDYGLKEGPGVLYTAEAEAEAGLEDW